MGSLKIKSVDINILGRSSQPFTTNPTPLNQSSQTTRSNFTASSQFTRPLTEKVVITTILSFDGLLLNFSIRQITTNETTKFTDGPSINIGGAGQPVHIKAHYKR